MSVVSYRTLVGIPPSTATTKDSVFVIIDAQNEFANGLCTVKNIAIARPAIGSLLQKYRKAGGHVVHVRHLVPDGTPVLTPGTPLAEEWEELRPGPSHTNEYQIAKWFPGAFHGTNLEELIKATGLRKIVLVGFLSHVCLSTTARDAHQKGYEVLIVEDGVGDVDIPGASGEDVRKTVLAELGNFFGTVVKSTDIV